jgi:hypothetical protein
MWRRSNLKYGNTKVHFDGQLFDSKGEANYYGELLLEKKAGLIKEIARQVRIPLVVNGTRVCFIVIDFRITYANGKVKYVEYKGYETDVYKLKRKLFQALYPEAEYEVVKHK